MLKKILLLAAITLMVLSCAHRPGPPDPLEQTGDVPSPTGRLYKGYLNSLEGVRHGSCPMFPSCSQYNRLAVKKFGLLKGWVMTFDRLLRCGRDETSLAPQIFIHGRLKYWDPVESHDVSIK